MLFTMFPEPWALRLLPMSCHKEVAYRFVKDRTSWYDVIWKNRML